MIPSDRRVLSRDEFVSLIVSRADDMTNVGKVMKFVEGIFKLQNDMSRPVYIFEASESITSDDIALLDREMNALGVACVLIPSGLISYVGEVTQDSFGEENLIAKSLGRTR